jgi:hypothetical protein
MCGAPTYENGSVMAMSEVGLNSLIEEDWKDAELVNGHCCMAANHFKEEEEFYNRMRLEQ